MRRWLPPGSITVVLNAPPSIVDLSPSTFIALLTAPPSLAYFAIVLALLALLFCLEPRLGSKNAMLHITLCSLLGASARPATERASAARPSFFDPMFSH